MKNIELHKIITEICKKHLEINIISIKELHQGIASNNYIIDSTAGELLVRVENGREAERIIQDQANSHLAKKRGVKVPPDPKLILEKYGQTFLVRKYISGTTVRQCIQHLPRNFFLKIGQNMAHIHQNQTPKSQPFIYDFLLNGRHDTWSKFLLLIDNCDGYKKNLLKYAFSVAKKFRKLLIKSNFTMIHGDFKPPNLLVDSESNLYVLDWDKSTAGPAITDIGFSLYHFFILILNNHLEFSVLKEILNGYHMINLCSKFSTNYVCQSVQLMGSAAFLTDALREYTARVSEAPDKEKRDNYFNNIVLPDFQIFVNNIKKLHIE